MNVLIANYGNESLALIQWAIEEKLEHVLVLSVDTGWHASLWTEHLDKVFHYMASHKINYQHLTPKHQFLEAIKDRGRFPSVKFQWCAPFLKGLPLNDAIDAFDFSGEAVIHLAKMKISSRANVSLISGEKNEHYQDRIVNYPLLDFSLEQRDKLLKSAGLTPLTHRSDECLPCIHARKSDIDRLSTFDKMRLRELELKIGSKMLPDELNDISKHETSQNRYDMGCGNIWGCGE